MGASIGSMIVSIEANTAKWSSDMATIERTAKQTFDTIEKYGDKAANTAKAFGLAVAGIGAGVGVSTLIAKFESVTASLGGLKEMAERTGSSVEKLSGLAAVARVGGRDMGELEGAVSKLNKALHANDDESKGAGKALAAIGLNITDLKRLDPATAFMEIAKAQERFADGGGKSAVMMDILGKQGAKQIPLMHDMAEQGDLVVKATTKQAEAADNLEKDLRRLTATKEALYKVVAVEIIPVYDSFIKVMIQANNETDGVRKAAKDLAADGSIRSWAETAAIAVAHVLDEFQLVKKLAIEIATPIERVGRNIFTLGALAGIATTGSLAEKKQAYADLKAENEKYYGELDQRLANNRQSVSLYSDRLKAQLEADRKAGTAGSKSTALDSYTSRAPTDGKNAASAKKTDPLGDWIKDYEARIKPANDALDKFSKLQRDAEESGFDLTRAEKAFYDLINTPEWQNMGDSYHDLIRAQFEAANAAEHTAKSEKALNELLANTPTARLEEARAKMLILAEAFDKGRINAEQFVEAANGVNGVKDNLEKTTDGMDEFAKKAAGSIQQSMADFLFDPFAKGTRGMLDGFGKALQRMAADAAAAQLAKSLFGTMGAATSGGGAGNWGWVGQAASWVGSMFANGGIMSSSGSVPLKTYAGGGVANSPQMSIFGEGSTPEAYVPLPDGRNIPVKMQGGGGSQANITVHVNSQTGDPAEIRRSAAAGARTALGIMNGARRYG